MILIVGFCLLDTIHGYIGAIGMGAHLPWRYFFFGFPEFWLAYLAVLPIAITVTSQYRLGLDQPGTLVPHLLGGLVFSYAHIAVVAAAPHLLQTLHPEWSVHTRFFVVMEFNFGRFPHVLGPSWRDLDREALFGAS